MNVGSLLVPGGLLGVVQKLIDPRAAVLWVNIVTVSVPLRPQCTIF